MDFGIRMDTFNPKILISRTRYAWVRIRPGSMADLKTKRDRHNPEHSSRCNVSFSRIPLNKLLPFLLEHNGQEHPKVMTHSSL